MVLLLSFANGWLACGSSPTPEVERDAVAGPEFVEHQSPPRVPFGNTVAMLRVHHRDYKGREVFIDGKARGPLPVNVVLDQGVHRFEILVGPGDRLVLERNVEPSPTVKFLDLGGRP